MLLQHRAALLLGSALLLAGCDDTRLSCSTDATKADVLDLVAQYKFDEYLQKSSTEHANGDLRWSPAPPGTLGQIVTTAQDGKLTSCEGQATYLAPFDLMAQALRKQFAQAGFLKLKSEEDVKQATVAVPVTYRVALSDDHHVIVSLVQVGQAEIQ